MKYFEYYLERKERWKTAGLWKRMARSADNLSQSKDVHETEIGEGWGEKRNKSSGQAAEEMQTNLKCSMLYPTSSKPK